MRNIFIASLHDKMVMMLSDTVVTQRTRWLQEVLILPVDVSANNSLSVIGYSHFHNKC
jgi:hypothetical protein